MCCAVNLTLCLQGVTKTPPPPSVSSQYSFGSNTQASSVEQRKRKFPIWPEWSEADVNAEKWDTGKGGKDKDKIGKSPTFVSKLECG